MSLTQQANTDIEVFAGMVEHDFALFDYFGTNSMRYFSGRVGEKLNQPIVSHGDPFFKADGTDHTSLTTSEMTAEEVPLFDPMKARDETKYSDSHVRPDLNHMMNYRESHARTLAEGKTIACISFLAKVAIAAGNTVSVDASATDGTAPANVKNGFKEVAGLMDDGRVGDGRRCLLKPTTFYELMDQDSVMSKDFGAAGTGDRNRAFTGGDNAGLNYLKIDIKNCPLAFGQDWTATTTRIANINLPAAVSADLTNVIGVVWHPAAWCLRDQIADWSELEKLPESQVWQLMSRYHFGLADLIVSLTNTNRDWSNTYEDGIYAILEDTTT